MSQEFTEDGMPIFIDTSGHLSAEQRSDIYRKLAWLEENDRDIREWLREIEIRLDDLVEIRRPNKKWWKRWKT